MAVMLEFARHKALVWITLVCIPVGLILLYVLKWLLFWVGFWGIAGCALAIWCGVVIWKTAKEYDAFQLGSIIGSVAAFFMFYLFTPIDIEKQIDILVDITLPVLVFLAIQGSFLRDARKKVDQERKETERTTGKYLAKLERVASAARRVHESHGLDVGTLEGRRLIKALLGFREYAQITRGRIG